MSAGPRRAARPPGGRPGRRHAAATGDAPLDPAALHAAAAAVTDPELPGLTIEELGVLRATAVEDGLPVVTLTPTYTGCPALREIALDVERRVRAAGAERVEVRVSLEPRWTTDWITGAGRAKLHAAGIAPPGAAPGPGPVALELGRRPEPVPCPRCGSPRTERLARSSGTACRSLHRCRDCTEPFEHVRPH